MSKSHNLRFFTFQIYTRQDGATSWFKGSKIFHHGHSWRTWYAIWLGNKVRIGRVYR